MCYRSLVVVGFDLYVVIYEWVGYLILFGE